MKKKGPKRRKPLQRKTRLRQGSSQLKRTALKQGSSQLKRTELKRTPMKRGRWSRADWERENTLDRRAHDAWRSKIIRRRCEVCLARRQSHDEHSKRDPHHILPARYIRRYVRTLRKQEHLTVEEARVLLRSLMYDTRNGMSVDRRCHDKHETAFRRIERWMIQPKAEQFARELGMTHVLDRIYGPRK